MASLAVDSSVVDESISVEHLLRKHRAAIDELKRMAPPPLLKADGLPWDGVVKYDDLFYLRYVLSFPSDPKSAADALKFTFEFRSTPEHRKRVELVASKEIEKEQSIVESKQWSVAGPLGIGKDGKPNDRGVLKEETGQGFVLTVRIAMCKRLDMSNCMPFAAQKNMQLLHREAGFQYVDRLTRETGLLCKQVMFFDFKGASLSSMQDSRTRGIQTEVSNIGKKAYPQLVDKLAMVNAPSWLAGILKVLKAVLPKSTLEKIELFSSTDSLWESDWAKRRLKRENMPHFLGGYLPEAELAPELSGQCLATESLPQITIKARAKEKVSVDIFHAGKSTVEFLVSILNRGVHFSIFFVPTTAANETGEEVVLRTEHKIEAADGPILEKLVVTGPGTLHLAFSNTHSMMRDKTVVYRLHVQNDN